IVMYPIAEFSPIAASTAAADFMAEGEEDSPVANMDSHHTVSLVRTPAHSAALITAAPLEAFPHAGSRAWGAGSTEEAEVSTAGAEAATGNSVRSLQTQQLRTQ